MSYIQPIAFGVSFHLNRASHLDIYTSKSKNTTLPIHHITYALVKIHLIYIYIYHTRITGWRRLIGSPKLQIIFHKRATKYRSLLRKMTHKDKGSYESSPPCTRNTHVYIHTLLNIRIYVIFVHTYQ